MLEWCQTHYITQSTSNFYLLSLYVSLLGRNTELFSKELDFFKITTLTSWLLPLPDKEEIMQEWTRMTQMWEKCRLFCLSLSAIFSLSFMIVSAASTCEFSFFLAMTSPSPGEGPLFCEFFQWLLLCELINGRMEMVAKLQGWKTKVTWINHTTKMNENVYTCF